jgi:hypothetical protein
MVIVTTRRIRSFTLDLTKSTRPLLDATKLWQAFCQAAGLSVDLPLTMRVWDEESPVALNRALPDVDGEPPVEIVTTDRSRRGHLDMEREVRIRGPRQPLEFHAVLARSGSPALGDSFAQTFTGRLNVESPPPWRLVSASVDFGPAGSLDRAWAVLETFAGWEIDEIADALSEVPELLVAFVEDGETGPVLSHSERGLLDRLLPRGLSNRELRRRSRRAPTTSRPRP